MIKKKITTFFAPLLVFLLMVLPLLSFVESDKKQSTITHVAEFQNKLYITSEYPTGGGTFNAYDIEKNQFEGIAAFEESRITKLMPSGESLIVEASSIGEGPKTHEDIYSISQQGEISKIETVTSDGFKQYESSLISADDKYIFGLKNELITAGQFSLNSFRYDRITKVKIANHFNENPNLIVRDIFEDNNFYWYACYQNPVATHWATLKGNLVVLRRDKITNDQKLIPLGTDIFEKGVSITGDNNYIWVLAENWFKDNVFKLSKVNLSYESFRISDFAYQIKEPSQYDSPYLWLFLSKNYEIYLNRFEKNNRNIVRVPLNETIKNYGAIAVDNNFIWVGVGQPTASYPKPHLVRLSKLDLGAKTIPIETSSEEKINNIKKSISSILAFKSTIVVSIIIEIISFLLAFYLSRRMNNVIIVIAIASTAGALLSVTLWSIRFLGMISLLVLAIPRQIAFNAPCACAGVIWHRYRNKREISK